MAETQKILDQESPAINTEAAMAAPGTGKTWVVSTLTICNAGNAASTARVHACIAGAASSVAQGTSNAIVYEIPVATNETVTLTLGITLAATDILRVRSGAGVLTFTAFGVEITA